MEARVEMLQQESYRVTSRSDLQRAQDRSIRSLKWAVAFCFVLISALVLSTVCLLRGNFMDKDKVIRKEQMGRLQGSDTRPMAHLPATKQTEASAQELQWEPERGLALLRNGMTYSNKSLIIPKDGYYFVYSQLYFRPAASTCNDTSISQSIIRSNANYPEPEIILSGISFCSKGSKIYHPITLVGLIELKKGDKLKVNMKPVTQVDTSFDHKSFFGAFLL